MAGRELTNVAVPELISVTSNSGREILMEPHDQSHVRENLLGKFDNEVASCPKTNLAEVIDYEELSNYNILDEENSDADVGVTLGIKNNDLCTLFVPVPRYVDFLSEIKVLI